MEHGKGLQERITAAVSPVVAAQGLELVDVEWQKESGRQFLRVFIDKPDGITLDDCAGLSRALDTPLEALALDQYCLEVSSPGAERPLKTDADLDRFRGRLVQLKLSQPIEGTKTLKGRLQGHDESALHLVVADREVTVPRTTIKSARLALVFPGSQESTEGGDRVVEL